MFYYPFFNPYNKQYSKYRYGYPSKYTNSIPVDNKPVTTYRYNQKETEKKQENRDFDSSDEMDFFEIFGLFLFFCCCCCCFVLFLIIS